MVLVSVASKHLHSGSERQKRNEEDQVVVRWVSPLDIRLLVGGVDELELERGLERLERRIDRDCGN